MTGSALPPAAWAAALAGLPGMGPARLGALLGRWPAEEAWSRVLSGRAVPAACGAGGRAAELTRQWQAAAAGMDVAARWRAHREAGVTVAGRGQPGYPSALVDDPEPPAVIFGAGRLSALERPRVAVVGTRRCSLGGRAVARELGADLAGAGVCVLSGLAFGIDAEAHAGSLAAGVAPPVGVVASGLDVVYPRRHAGLWSDVRGAGALLSEYPLGTPPARWRFPARNRILAGLADVVVIVESHARGGSMHTVDAAIERGRTVMAVPGSVRSPASAGTNDLLASGCAPVRDAGDVLVALGLDAAATGRTDPGAGRPVPSGLAGSVLESVGGEPATLQQVAQRLDCPPGPVAVQLARLIEEGWLAQKGAWFERVAPA